MDKKISQLTSATLPLAGMEILPMVQGGATVKALQADLFQWPTGRVTYVPIGGNIQAAVTAATAGDTLILGAGSYPITATITVDKAILIKGQGLSATKVTTATPNLAVFTLTASTARVTDLYIGNTGTGTSYAIYAGDGLTQLQVSNVIAVLGGNGLKYGVWSQSSVTVSNSEMYITSADQNSNGVVIYNDSAATVNISVNVQNVRVLATGATLNNRGVVFNNNNTAKTITGNVTNCNLTAYASSGATDIALYVQSTTTFNSTVNAYDSVLSGADSDVTVTGTNSCTLFNCTLVNGTTTGTIAYGGTQVVAKLNGNTITKGTGVLTLAAGKTLTASNTLTLAGTDATTQTFPTTSATIARTDAAQTFTGDQTLSAGNIVQGTAAKGFNFTANTPAAGMTSQLFNWYEEGTWTAAFASTSGTITISASFNTGSYTKIGRQVTLTGLFITSSVSSPTGVLTITGLPFTSASTNKNGVAGNVWAYGLNATASPIMCKINAGSSVIQIDKFVLGSATDLAGDMIASSQFTLGITYFTS